MPLDRPPGSVAGPENEKARLTAGSPAYFFLAFFTTFLAVVVFFAAFLTVAFFTGFFAAFFTAMLSSFANPCFAPSLKCNPWCHP